MKKLIPLICSFILVGNIFSQIPNAGFQTWGATDPINWLTSNNNAGAVINVTQSTNAHAGGSAMKLEIWTYMGFTLPSIAACPDQDNFFPYAGQPACLNGWYIGNFAGSDYLSVLTDLRLNSTSTGAGSLNINTNTATYAAFSVPIIYQNPVNSDSAVITFSLGTGSSGTIGSYVILDDLQYGSCIMGLNDEIITAEIKNIFPNPANDQLNLNYLLMANAMVSLDLIGSDGKSIRNFFKGEKSAGNYQETLDIGDIPAGNYFIQVTSNNKKLVEKIVIQ